jgi:hypothetical protein
MCGDHLGPIPTGMQRHASNAFWRHQHCAQPEPEPGRLLFHIAAQPLRWAQPHVTLH